MRNQTRTSFSATTAIAAALALTAAPALAQDASSTTLDGPIVNSAPVQPAPATTAPAPVFTLPVTTASPAPVVPTTSASPVVQQIPETPAAEPAPPAAKTAVKTSAPAPKQAALKPAPVASTPASEPVIDTTTEAAPTVLAPLAQEPLDSVVADQAAPRATTAPTPTQTRDVTGFLALVLAGLIAIVVGALLAFGFRRRREMAHDSRAAATHSGPDSKYVVVAEPKSTRVITPAQAPLAPAMANAAAPAMFREPLVKRTTPTDDYVRGSHGASVPLPSELPETFEERDALILRMVAAKPDKANPFVTPQARLRRSRLILQSLGRKFENTKPWIDFSQYPEIWPSQAPDVVRSTPAPTADTRILEPA